jgi:phage-related protein
VVLAAGFQKKTQKTPSKFIALAEERRADHLQRRRYE